MGAAGLLTFAQARTGHWQVPASALVVATFFGGVIGVVVAGTLEYDALRGLGALPMFFVALIEESAKMIVSIVLLITLLGMHTAWDTFGGVLPFIILAVLSLGWLLLALHRYRAFAEHSTWAPGEPLTV